MASGQVLRFDRFTLDLPKRCLHAGDRVELKLRPKSFDVLRYLVVNPGRVVTKDELASTVWPKVVVTDDSLVQCIRDVRAVLGDDGQRFIRTIPRCGYMFVADVDMVAASRVAAPPSPDDGGAIAHDARAAEGETLRSRPWSRHVRWMASSMALAVVVATAVAIAVAGRQSDAPVATENLTIAVLPFASLDPQEPHFGHGIAEDLITAVSRFRDVAVIARNSSFRYRGDVDVAQAGRELGASFVVRGSVGRDEGRARINVQLVDTRSGATRWAARYDRPLGSLFELQDEVADQVVSKLVGQARHFSAERLRTRHPSTLEAYELVLKARQGLMTYGHRGTSDAHALLHEATAIDPSYAPAWVLLARVYVRLYLHPMDDGHLSPQVLEQARGAALEAVSLDPDSSHAHAVLGYVQLWQHQYDASLASLRHAIALNPNDADAFFYHGDALGRAGEHRASIEALERTRRLDPFAPSIVPGLIARSHIMLGEHDQALALSRECSERAPHVNACLVTRAVAAAALGASAEAQTAVRRLLEIYPSFSIGLWPRRFRLDWDETLYIKYLRAAGFPE